MEWMPMFLDEYRQQLSVILVCFAFAIVLALSCYAERNVR